MAMCGSDRLFVSRTLHQLLELHRVRGLRQVYVEPASAAERSPSRAPSGHCQRQGQRERALPYRTRQHMSGIFASDSFAIGPISLSGPTAPMSMTGSNEYQPFAIGRTRHLWAVSDLKCNTGDVVDCEFGENLSGSLEACQTACSRWKG